MPVSEAELQTKREEDVMKDGFFLITGTSRGIGEALARKLLETGNAVLGVSRNRPATLNSTKYYHLSFDLTETSRINQIMEKVDEIVGDQSFGFVCLVNNASAVEPTSSIDKCPPPEIEAHLRIGLIAPMILTSLFIRKFADDQMRKKVVFISSGSAFTAGPDMSVYCSSKAGLHMFAQCVGLEQNDREYGFEVMSIGPGMVDTSMQATVRSKTSDEFAMVDFFKQAHEDGRLQEPDRVAEKLYTTIQNKYEQGQFIEATKV